MDQIQKEQHEGHRRPDLFVECGRVGSDAHVGLLGRLVDVLQTVAVGVHDETCVVVEQHAHAVVAQLVACNATRVPLLNCRRVGHLN